ncbi:hypothetical protein [Micromonospora schwarzwaldensis]
MNLVSGDDLFIPGLVVLRSPAGGFQAADVTAVLLLGAIARSA